MLKPQRNLAVPTKDKPRIKVELPPLKVGAVPPGSVPIPSFSPEELKLIFLDIDGVLNSVKTYVLHKVYPDLNGPADRTETGSYVNHLDAFDKCSVGLINQLCLVTGAKIVLSSSWRRDFDTWEIKEFLNEIGILPEYVIGRTDEIEGKEVRGQEIASFIESMDYADGRQALMADGLLDISFEDYDKVKVISYVIFDDEEKMLDSQAAYFIKVNGIEGLSLMQTTMAGSILEDDPLFSINALQGKASAGTPGFVLN